MSRAPIWLMEEQHELNGIQMIILLITRTRSDVQAIPHNNPNEINYDNSPLNFDLMFANSLLIRFTSASLLLPENGKILQRFSVW